MTKADKRIFIRNLCNSIRDEAMRSVTAERIPDNWDGVEIRQFLADKFSSETYPSLLMGKRRREFENTVIVNNL